MAIDWDGFVLGPVMGIFGDAVIYTPRGGTPIPIADGIWDEGATTTVITDGEEVTIQTPLLGIRVAALNGIVPAQNDRVQIVKTGMVYLVANPEADGHGHVLLRLMKAQP